MEHKNDKQARDDIKKGPLFGMRHWQLTLLFLDGAILYINRLNIAVAIVAMTNANTSNPDFPEFDWNETEKSYILSSFYWGYILTQFPGGYCVRHFGVKINLFICSLMSGLFSLLVPLSVTWGGWKIFCLLRFLLGFFQGNLYAGMQQHVAAWSPPKERSLFNGFTHMGFDCGIVIAMALSGVIAASPLGWPGIFYISAALCFIWCIVWLIFGANSASASKFISKAEQNHIEESTKNSVDFTKKKIPIPWRAIFTSKTFYALLIVRSASEFGFFTIQTEWPTYINAVLKMDIKDNALYSASPALVSLIFQFIFIYINDLITKRNLLSSIATRKFFNSFSMWIPAAGLIFIGFLNEDQKLFAIILMTLLVAIHTSIIMGCVLCCLEIAPNHTSMIISIINMITNFVIMLGPLYVGVIVNEEENRSQWQIVFATIAIFFCLGDAVFLFWGTDKEQTWNAADFLVAKDEEAGKDICPTISSAFQQNQTEICERANASAEKKLENALL